MEWQRFKTTRLYLHPPKSERIITLWRDGKIMLGEVEAPITKPYKDISAAGLWFIDGEGRPADFKESEFSVRDDGIPVHMWLTTLGDLSVELECVCDFTRAPSAHVKATVKAAYGGPVSTKLGFMLRSGKEIELIYSAPDVYAIYDHKISDWKDIKPTWSYDGAWRSGDYFLSSDTVFEYDETTGIAQTDVCLDEGESRSFTFVLGKGDEVLPDFDKVKESAVTRWSEELKRIKRLPKEVATNETRVSQIKSLTVQLLQCFCYAVGKDALYSRQGGLQRRVWTFESMPVLTALERLGDFDDYIEPVLDVYFNEFYEESGEIVPLGIHWAMATGTVLYSFGRYSAVRGRDYYLKYRDKALRCFDWIKKTRRTSTYGGRVAQSERNKLNKNTLIDGLFPPMSSCDDPLAFQSWLTTDCTNVCGVLELFRAAELHGDERAAEILEEYEAYRGVISAEWEQIKASAQDSDEIEVPYSTSGNNEEIAKRFAFSPGTGRLADTLELSPEDCEKIIRCYTRRGEMRGGLYNKMPNKDPNIPGVVISKIASVGFGYIWYVCAQEYNWFCCFLRQGNLEKCKEIISDAEKYAMSDEYYMLERYHQRDVWYSPWSPNASCNGRFINMIIDYYECEANNGN
ncbi:MAG: hypothetical protein IJY69_01560 [Clostridia bacterium]|nr:hypothetical protein [Clostridia bacterium]